MSAVTAGPTLELSAAGLPDQTFVFHRAADPELWRTTVPLIVRLRCGRHKGLIATWLAIHWLMVLYSTREDHVFGVREIAQEAGVGRNELSGPNGHIQRLLALGLIQIVGYKVVKRTLPRCPIYHIDLPGLERQSIEAIQELLRTRGLPAPPRPAPDPRQLDLFDQVEAGSPRSCAGSTAGGIHTAQGRSDLDVHRATPAAGTAATGPSAEPTGGAVTPQFAIAACCPELGRSDGVAPENGTVTMAHVPGRLESRPYAPKTGTVTMTQGQSRPKNEPGAPENGTGTHPIGAEQCSLTTAMPENGIGGAPDRDMEGKTDRKTEGESARAPDLLLALATAAARTAILEVLQQLPPHVPGTVATAPAIPEPPDGETRLPAPVLDLWGADRPMVLQRDRFQLEQLAAATDHATGGHGAYWLGRAILMAETCLEPRGQRPTVAYLRALLRRWQREGTWGSDLAEDEGVGLPASPQSPHPLPVTPPATTDTVHPGVEAYQMTFGRTPNAVQVEQIAATVTDLAVWQRVLTDWQANGWQAGAVAKMLDRYRKEAAPAADDGPPPSVATIHTYPGLASEQRDRWIRKFHAAATPAEKRAVLSRLEQEHPR